MRRRLAAFTVIELVVVVLIGILLVVILLPRLTKARDVSILLKCQSNLHQIGIAMATYNHQNKDWMPQTETWERRDPSDTPGNYHIGDPTRGWINYPAFYPGKQWLNLSWPEALYIDGDLAMNPGNKGGLLGYTDWNYPICYAPLFMCPSHPVDQRRGDDHTQWGYGMAWCATTELLYIPNSPVLRPVLNRNLVPHHIVATDAQVLLGSQGGYHTPATNDYGVFQRHKNNQTRGANYLMADYHVEWSDRYALTPSPLSFYYNYTTAADRQRAATEGFIWAHGVSMQR